MIMIIANCETRGKLQGRYLKLLKKTCYQVGLMQIYVGGGYYPLPLKVQFTQQINNLVDMYFNQLLLVLCAPFL